MNIKRLTKLAEWLEGGAKHQHLWFDMGVGYQIIDEPLKKGDPLSCNTACCIAGAAFYFFMPNDEVRKRLTLGEENSEDWRTSISWRTLHGKARCLLALDWEQSTRLFTPHEYYPVELHEFTDPAWAARTIRHLIATGEVDWKLTDDDGVLTAREEE